MAQGKPKSDPIAPVVAALRSREGLIIVVSAPSGAGKTTVCDKLLKDMPELAMSVSYTTRKPRESEENSRDYVFVSKEDFLKEREKGLFLEWAEVHGHLYGTPRDFLERRIENGSDTVLDIDVQGAELIHAAIPDAVLVLLLPPSLDELERRLRGRGSDSDEDIQIRLDNAIAEFERNSMFDYFVVNEDFEKAVESLKAIIRAERRRAGRLRR